MVKLLIAFCLSGIAATCFSCQPYKPVNTNGAKHKGFLNLFVEHDKNYSEYNLNNLLISDSGDVPLKENMKYYSKGNFYAPKNSTKWQFELISELDFHDRVGKLGMGELYAYRDISASWFGLSSDSLLKIFYDNYAFHLWVYKDTLKCLSNDANLAISPYITIRKFDSSYFQLKKELSIRSTLNRSTSHKSDIDTAQITKGFSKFYNQVIRNPAKYIFNQQVLEYAHNLVSEEMEINISNLVATNDFYHCKLTRKYDFCQETKGLSTLYIIEELFIQQKGDDVIVIDIQIPSKSVSIDQLTYSDFQSFLTNTFFILSRD